MQTIHIDRKDQDKVRPILSASFPGYSGQMVKVVVGEQTINTTSHWSGGSRDTFVVLNLSTMQNAKLGQSGTMFDKHDPLNVPVVKDLAVIKHCIFQGKDLGITIFIHPDNAGKLIEQDNTDLSLVEKAVILATAGFKSSYGGVKDLRKQEVMRQFKEFNSSDIDSARESLIIKGMMKANKSLTTKGKNVAETLPNSLYGLAARG